MTAYFWKSVQNLEEKGIVCDREKGIIYKEHTNQELETDIIDNFCWADVIYRREKDCFMMM